MSIFNLSNHIILAGGERKNRKHSKSLIVVASISINIGLLQI